LFKKIEKPDNNNTCCIIVTYFPENNLIDKVINQMSKVIVVDNGSSPQYIIFLKQLADSNKIILIKNEKNMGIALALNQGIKLALSLGYLWILTLDQDTEAHKNMLQEYSRAFLLSNCNIFIFGCNYYNVNKGKFLYKPGDEKNNLLKKVKSVITSGTLIHKLVFDTIGYYRDDFFIDSVDHEYCLRARKYGFDIGLLKKPLMVQYIGETKKDSLLNNFFSGYWHKPIRNYYIARNTTKIIKMYVFSDFFRCLRHFLRLTYKGLTIVLVEDEKKAKFLFYLKGIVHGIMDKMGNYES